MNYGQNKLKNMYQIILLLIKAIRQTTN